MRRFCLFSLLLLPLATAAERMPADWLDMPAGFSAEELFSAPNARAMVWGDDGTLFVSSLSKGVHAVRDPLGPLQSGRKQHRHI